MAEEPLPAGGSCLLGSLNLGEFVLFPFTDQAQIDWDSLEEATRLAVRALNQVLIEGIELHSLQEQRDSVTNWRQIGLGTLGLADCLIKLQTKYGSQESLYTIDNIYKQIATYAVLESLDMAKESGCYPAGENYKDLIAETNFIKTLELPEDVLQDIRTYGLYNSQLLTCAPTGSIGTLLSASTGVEPLFAYKTLRKTITLENQEKKFEVNAKVVQDYIALHPNTTIETLPDYFTIASEIKPIDRILVQSHLQKYIDASISSTINLPNSATVEQVEEIYLEAWKNKLKGVTVYRAGCKREPVLVDSNTATNTSSTTEKIMITNAPKRPKVLIADFHSVKAKGEQFIVLVGLLDQVPYEVFAFKPNLELNIPEHEGVITKKSKMHYSFTSPMLNIKNLESINNNIEEKATTLYASLALRHGTPIEYITKTMKKVNENITSFSSAISRVLSKYIPKSESGDKCPECGGTLINEGGCTHCNDCGWSRCS